MNTQTTKSNLQQAIASLESTAMNFAMRFIPDQQTRIRYNKMAKQLSIDILEQIRKNQITVSEGAAKASEMRNILMDTLRGSSSEIGRAYARMKKATGKTLSQLQEIYAQERFGKAFAAMSSTERNIVWKEIVFAAGRPQDKANQVARAFGTLGKGFFIFTMAVCAYNILTADDKLIATANEGAVLGAGLLGSMAGGAVAGLVCGPAAPVCSGVGIFLGGVMFAIGGQIAFDYAR